MKINVFSIANLSEISISRSRPFSSTTGQGPSHRNRSWHQPQIFEAFPRSLDTSNALLVASGRQLFSVRQGNSEHACRGSRSRGTRYCVENGSPLYTQAL